LWHWTDAASFAAFDVVAAGPAPLGAGVKTALKMIEARKFTYRAAGISYVRPWLIILTDGASSQADDWNDAAAAARSAEAAGKCTIFPIAVGTDAHIDMLQKASARPVTMLDAAALSDKDLWPTYRGLHGTQAPCDGVQLPAMDWSEIRS
jgi:uncharacterized protein YegL